MSKLRKVLFNQSIFYSHNLPKAFASYFDSILNELLPLHTTSCQICQFFQFKIICHWSLISLVVPSLKPLSAIIHGSSSECPFAFAITFLTLFLFFFYILISLVFYYFQTMPPLFICFYMYAMDFLCAPLLCQGQVTSCLIHHRETSVRSQRIWGRC